MAVQPFDRPAPGSLAEAERQRLAQREQRLHSVVTLLRERRADYAARGGAPRPLTEAIHGFAQELGTVRSRLAGLEARSRHVRPQP
jgi:hypothetical protein